MVRRARPQSVLPTCAAAFATAFVAACADRTPVDPAVGRPALQVRGGGGTTTTPGRYLVGFDRPTAAIAPSVLAAAGGRVVDSIPAFNVLVVDGATNPGAFLQGGARYVEPEFETTIDAIPADGAPGGGGVAAVPEGPAAPWYASGIMWDMKAMKADEGWAMTDGGAGVTICIVDSGVDDGHQELNGGKVLLRANFVAGAAENRVDDPNGHGTHVAGTAAARGTVVAGVAPRANLLSARVLNTAGSGSETAITNGIRWCADNGAHVMNVSIGGVRYRGQNSFNTSPVTYGNAVQYANARGVVVIVSAGNNNFPLPNPSGAMLQVPSQVAGVLNVGATGPLSRVGTFPSGGGSVVLPLAAPGWNPFDPAQVWQGPDGKAFYSNYGTGVGVFAPGGRGGVPLSSPYRFYNRVAQGITHDAIWSSCSGQSTNSGFTNVGGAPSAGSASCSGQTARYWAINGTSMAAPHVTGMAALLYAELGGGTRTDAKRQRVIDCIRTTTDVVGPASVFGGGRVNVKKAIEAVRSGAC